MDYLHRWGTQYPKIIKKVQYTLDPQFRKLIGEGIGENFEYRFISGSLDIEVKFFLEKRVPITRNYYLREDELFAAS